MVGCALQSLLSLDTGLPHGDQFFLGSGGMILVRLHMGQGPVVYGWLRASINCCSPAFKLAQYFSMLVLLLLMSSHRVALFAW